jgi:hypothetical protein
MASEMERKNEGRKRERKKKIGYKERIKKGRKGSSLWDARQSAMKNGSEC